MAADDERRTEPASRRRLQRARAEGRIARGRDLATVTTLTALLCVAGIGVDDWAARLQAMLRAALAGAARPSAPSAAESEAANAWLAAFWSIADPVLACVWPVLALAVAAAVVGHGAQTGWQPAPGALASRLSEFSLAQNARRIFSPRGVAQVLLSSVKVALLLSVVAVVTLQQLPTLLRLPLLGSMPLQSVLFDALTGFAKLLLVALAPMALVDFGYQRAQGRRALRMTRDEVRREQREDLGDPLLRSHRRHMSAQLLVETPLQRTVHASLVLSDPFGSIAVAILRDERSPSMPWLVNKGRGRQARAIVDVARANGIRLVVHGALAARIASEVAIDADLGDERAAAIHAWLPPVR